MENEYNIPYDNWNKYSIYVDYLMCNDEVFHEYYFSTERVKEDKFILLHMAIADGTAVCVKKCIDLGEC